ncbi:MAG: hypothetical protein SFX19_08690 [Alphaproteobacteria bacterium]|nr:hypothetical protein [Alphaproteobacteria bacterium]
MSKNFPQEVLESFVGYSVRNESDSNRIVAEIILDPSRLTPQSGESVDDTRHRLVNSDLLKDWAQQISDKAVMVWNVGEKLTMTFMFGVDQEIDLKIFQDDMRVLKLQSEDAQRDVATGGHRKRYFSTRTAEDPEQTR